MCLGIAVPSKPKSRASAHPLPVSDRPLLQLRSNSLPDAPQSAHSPAAAASLTVALPPIKDLSLAGAPPVPPRLQRAATSYDGFSANAVSSPVSLSSPSQDIDESSQNMANECTVCFENVCDSVVYTCGHMCMCYNCAVQVKASADPLCPICRQDIKDVIRIFKS